MDIQKQALIAEIEIFKTESLKTHVVKVWADSYENSDPFGYTILKNNKVWWMKTQAHQLWQMWQAAKAQAVPEGFVLVPKEKIESLVDGLHSAFQSNPTLTLGDLLPLQQDFQAMIEAQEQGHD